MNEILISSKRTEGRYSAIPAIHRKKCSVFQQVQQRFGNLRSIAKIKQDNRTLARQIANVYSVQKHPILKGCINFRKGVLKKDCENMHFDASETFIKMMMDLISSAKDKCMVFGICDDLGKINEIDIERHMFSAEVVLCSKNLEELQTTSTTCSWTFVKLCVHSRGKFLSKNIIFRECFACSRWKILTAEWNFWLFPNHENSCGSCRKSEGTYRQKNLLDCVTLHITQKSRRSAASSRQDFLDTALECSAKFAEKLADPPVLKVDYFFEESDLEGELSRSKEYIFSTMKDVLI